MSLRDVVGAVPYDFVYPSLSEGVRSKNDRVYAGFPILLFIDHGGLRVGENLQLEVSPEPMWGSKGEICGAVSPLILPL